MIKHSLTIKLICLLFFVHTLSLAQNELRVDYKVAYTGPKMSTKKEISREQKVLLENTLLMMQNAVKQQAITLYTKPNNQFLLVTIEKMSIDNQLTTNLGNSLLNLHTYLYGQDENVVLGYSTGKDYIVKYENKFVEWTISKDTKDILGLKCFRAIPKYTQPYDQKELANYATEVWFTPTINKRGGPLKYANLPGLVLEVATASFVITASNIQNIKENKVVPKINKKIITELQHYKNVKAVGAAIESRAKK